MPDDETCACCGAPLDPTSIDERCEPCIDGECLFCGDDYEEDFLAGDCE